jgi:hypothetical protein
MEGRLGCRYLFRSPDDLGRPLSPIAAPIFEKLSKQLSDLLFPGRQGASASGREPVYTTNLARLYTSMRSEQPLLFEPVKDRVQRPGAELVSVSRKLFDHPETEDSFLNCVMENVKADQP